MRVSFSLHPRKLGDGSTEEVEFVSIHTGRDGKDVVSRAATDADRKRWASEYAAFCASTEPAPTPPQLPSESVQIATNTKSKKKG